jgi:hypothetical protein
MFKIFPWKLNLSGADLENWTIDNYVEWRANNTYGRNKQCKRNSDESFRSDGRFAIPQF